MKTLLMALVLALPLTASAQFEIQVGLPSIRFEVPPPVVVVNPGVQVVVDYPEEVFVVNGFYWSRRGDRWYRSHDHHGEWVYVEHVHVPRSLVAIPHGKYKHYKHDGKVVHSSGKKGKWKHKGGDDDHGHGGGGKHKHKGKKK